MKKMKVSGQQIRLFLVALVVIGDHFLILFHYKLCQNSKCFSERRGSQVIEFNDSHFLASTIDIFI